MPKRNFITVHGNLSFPIDMLHYDMAWPATETDARKIERTKDGDTGYLEIQLVTDNMDAPTRERWQSFGWKVIAVVRTA